MHALTVMATEAGMYFANCALCLGGIDKLTPGTVNPLLLQNISPRC